MTLVQAQSPYYAADDERRDAAIHHNVMDMGSGGFVTTVRHKPYGQTGEDKHDTCRVNTPYETATRSSKAFTSMDGSGTLTHPSPFTTANKKKTLFEDNWVPSQKVVS